ncbi:MAG: hypothetical protein GC185_01395 [Alphaproteobacteria bacterium]|nr:hypothetical protein [Alphaproteobacteria bacterium]
MAEQANEQFEMLNDYTLAVSTVFSLQSRADPTLRRVFNFRARQVTEIYSMWYSQSVTSSMQSKNFSDYDSADEILLMHKKLVDMGGRPPALDDMLKTLRKPALAPREN